MMRKAIFIMEYIILALDKLVQRLQACPALAPQVHAKVQAIILLYHVIIS
jgi:hypothetical protein